jgi:hypothetical protein
MVFPSLYRGFPPSVPVLLHIFIHRTKLTLFGGKISGRKKAGKLSRPFKALAHSFIHKGVSATPLAIS